MSVDTNEKKIQATNGYGAESILRQGFMGFIFSWVYIKNGHSLKSSIFLHMSWNLFCITENIW